MDSYFTDEFFDVWCDTEWNIVFILLHLRVYLHLFLLRFSILRRQLWDFENISLDFFERMLTVFDVLLSAWAKLW